MSKENVERRRAWLASRFCAVARLPALVAADVP
jgi:4'-phosphopantetheinyl transferase EntD